MKDNRTHHLAAAAIVAQMLVAALVIALLAPVAAVRWLVNSTGQALQHAVHDGIVLREGRWKAKRM